MLIRVLTVLFHVFSCCYLFVCEKKCMYVSQPRSHSAIFLSPKQQHRNRRYACTLLHARRFSRGLLTEQVKWTNHISYAFE